MGKIKEKLKISTQSKVVIITIVLAVILLCNVLAPYKEYIAGQILFAKDKLIYVKMDEEHSFKPTWDKMELVEKSTTSDDSVCIVSDMTKEQKNVFKNQTGNRENDMLFYEHMQRVSSNKFAQISYTYKKPFIFAKPEGYEKEKDIEAYYDYAENFGGRLTSIKLQIYDIDKKKVVSDKELMSDKFKEERYAMLYGFAGKMLITKSQTTSRAAIVIPYYEKYAPKDKLYPFKAEIDTNGMMDKRPCKGYTTSIRTTVRRNNWLEYDDFIKLLKQNGVNTKGVVYGYNDVDYNNVNLMIRTEYLPKEDAYLYKVYPKLKKYIGKKGKIAKFYLKGLQNSDELASYFLPEGQKVSYGDGIKNEAGNIIKSLKDYNSDKWNFDEISDNERLSADSFDFK